MPFLNRVTNAIESLKGKERADELAYLLSIAGPFEQEVETMINSMAK